jgi:hypothetical protein
VPDFVTKLAVFVAQRVHMYRAMKRSALHWTVAFGCFAVSAVAACTAEAPLDASPGAGGQSSATGTGDVVSGGENGKPGGVETTATGLPCDVDKVLKTR